VARWRLSALPGYLESWQMQRLLRHFDNKTAKGIRDRAIVMLLGCLGLRAGEVRMLTLDDIDWTAGRINVYGKGGKRSQLPLPRDVGEALVRYLRHGRPRCVVRQVFVRMRAPHTGLVTSSAIARVVKRALDRAGLDVPHKGSHLLRHTCATLMLRRGASLSEIGRILRHEDPDTTAVYAKVDLGLLRCVAQPWQGGAQ
jgi:site-specific recombinase XerD